MDIVKLQMILEVIREFADDKEPNIRRGALDLLEKIYKDTKGEQEEPEGTLLG